MHLVINKKKSGKEIYQSILLRESYREEGKIKKRTIANLSHCKPEEIEAIRIALSKKKNLKELTALSEGSLQEGKIFGALWIFRFLAKKVGLIEALGDDFSGKLALFQVFSRLFQQGSRLSSTRLGRLHEVGSILEFSRGFDENDLYDNLSWLSDRQDEIEDCLWQQSKKKSRNLFLYDVTSSYLEGQNNELAFYGYNRDKKKGKKQIVIGLLCDQQGEPVSVEVFEGNRSDSTTFNSQVEKVKQRFGCKKVIMVGDRGMIKSRSIQDLPKDFFYITALTKSQIEKQIIQENIQLSFFEEDLYEVELEDKRYILRRNPIRRDEIRLNRESKMDSLKTLLQKQNLYLKEHPKAQIETAFKKIEGKRQQLGLSFVTLEKEEDRKLSLRIDAEKQEKESRLDGCYTLVTNVAQSDLTKEKVHQKYKDLAQVEWAFRSLKTTHLEIRPIHVRKEKSTRAHVFIAMLAYKVLREMKKICDQIGLQLDEIMQSLKTFCCYEWKVKKETVLKIFKPRDLTEQFFAKAGCRIPDVLPYKRINVVTRKKTKKQLEFQ